MLAGAGVVVLAVVLVVIATAGGGDGTPDATKVAAAMRAAGCTYKDSPGFELKPGVMHVTSLKATVKYRTFPPAAGPHYQTPAVWDFWTDPVNPLLVVHNEEHGGVILWWGEKVPDTTVEQLRRFYDESPVSMLGTPIEGLGAKVAISAWTGDPSKYGKNGNFGVGHVAVCPGFNEKAFKTFRDGFRGKGPEGISMSNNQPGT